MKKITLLILSLMTVSFALADKLTVDQARQKALAYLNQGTSTQRRAASKTDSYKLIKESKAYYLFSGNAGNGFIIAAADDRMASPVLGYADSGSFDLDNMPENMKWWLSFYDEEAASLTQDQSDCKVSPFRADRSSWKSIEPMLTTMWDQSPIYNDSCPKLKGNLCSTGCVATATAQLMGKYKWPATGKGVSTYKWTNGNMDLTADFSKSTYDWVNMTSKYDTKTSTETEKRAIAKLMKDVGYAVKMQYGEGGSQADSENVPYALFTYFGYSREACLYEHAYYNHDEWEEMAYESLARQEPVYISGDGTVGHAFICDGYTSGGYFHINWGWAGVDNGNFLLSCLRPDRCEWGGGMNGFTARQKMVLNVRPDKDNTSKAIAHLYCPNDFDLKFDVNKGYYILSGGFYNHTLQDISATLGLEFVNAEGKSSFNKANTPELLSAAKNEGYKTFNFGKDIFPTENGTYKVYPAYYDGYHDTFHRLRVPNYYRGYVNATIKDGTIEITKPDTIASKITVSDIKHGKFYADEYTDFSLTVKNDGKERYASNLYFGFYDYAGNKWAAEAIANFVDLQPGASTPLKVKVRAPLKQDSNYKLEVYDDRFKTLSRQECPEIYTKPTGTFAAILTSKPEISFNAYNDLNITANLSLTSGFTDQFIVYFYSGEGGKSIASIKQGLPMGAGDSSGIFFSSIIPVFEPETVYNYEINACQNDQNLSIKYGTTEYFTFTTPKKDYSGIETLNSQSSTISSQPYNLAGQRVSNNARGIVIVGGKKIFKN